MDGVLSSIMLPVLGFIGVRMLAIPTRSEVDIKLAEGSKALKEHETRDDESFQSLETQINVLANKVDRHFEEIMKTLLEKR